MSDFYEKLRLAAGDGRIRRDEPMAMHTTFRVGGPAAYFAEPGGEDALALGSDFDGIPENPYLRTPADVPDFLEELEGAFGCRIAEKIAYGNFLRVFGEICK